MVIKFFMTLTFFDLKYNSNLKGCVTEIQYEDTTRGLVFVTWLLQVCF